MSGIVFRDKIRWVEHVARMLKGRVAYRGFVVRPEGNRPLGTPSCRWKDNIKGDL